jgi:hypothetical protein
MRRRLLRVLIFYVVVMLVLIVAAFADDQSAERAIQEEVWTIPVTLPITAYSTNSQQFDRELRRR